MEPPNTTHEFTLYLTNLDFNIIIVELFVKYFAFLHILTEFFGLCIFSVVFLKTNTIHHYLFSNGASYKSRFQTLKAI